MTRSPSKSSGSNIVRLSGLLSLALGVFGLVVGAMIMYASIQGQLDSEQASNAASNQAREIGDSLAEIQAAIQNPQVIGLARDLLREGRTQSEALEAAVQRRGVPNIIDLRVFPVEVESIELGEYPEPDFSVIEMLLEARAEGRAPIQVHYPGQAIENLALAQAVEVDAGVEGIIFLRVPVSMATSLLKVVSYIDAVAIIQGQGQQAHTIRNLGQLSGAIEVTPIPGSRFSLHWTRQTFASSFSKQSAVIILSIGTILLMIGLLIRQRFGVLDTSSLGGSLRKQAKPKTETEKTADVSPPTPKPVSRKKPTPAKKQAAPQASARQKKKADPPAVDDLPDWLLDSDQIDQTDAPLGDGGDELPDLPDTLSDRVDDTVGGEKRAAASGDGLVADTVFFNPDEEGFFDQDDSPHADGKPDEDASEDEVHWPEHFDIDKDEPAAIDQRDTTPPNAVRTMEDDDHVEEDIDWDDFNSEIEHEELLTGSDEEAIDAALAELEEPSAEPAESKEPADSEVAAEAGSEDRQDLLGDDQGSAQTDRGHSEPVLHPGLLKANSIGGIVGEHLDTRAATLIGEAIGSEAMSRGVNRMVVGRDGRLDGPQLMSALSQGLRSAGVDVVDIGAVPIPVLNFAAHELSDGSGVMVTGSHYPAEHNGFRI